MTAIRPTASSITDAELDQLYQERQQARASLAGTAARLRQVSAERDQLRAERDHARRWAVALENELAAAKTERIELRERARTAQSAALALRAQTPTAAQGALGRIRAARSWVDVWVALGMYYGLSPEQAGAEARNRRENGAIRNLADAEQRVRASRRRAERAEAERDRLRARLAEVRRYAELAASSCRISVGQTGEDILRILDGDAPPAT